MGFSGAILSFLSDNFVDFQIVGKDLLVGDLRFGEQNGPFMQLLLSVFGGFAAGLVGAFVLLRFEAKVLSALFGSEL